MSVFPCPRCQNELRAGDDQGGQEIRCPRCGQQSTVPIADAVSSGSTRLAGQPPAPSTAENSVEVDAHAKTAPDVHEDNTLTRDPATPPAAPTGDLYDFLAPAQRPDEIGRLGPYRVLRLLGAGGMGIVFLAEDVHLERPVALKAMKPALAASESSKKRFLREAKAMAALKHDHIVVIHQVGEDRGVPFLAMEFLEGELLDDRLKREKKLPAAEVLRIGREVADGLAAAHARGLIHRDIKPGNVWLEGKRGRVKILDFGLARAACDDAHLTQSGVIIGTPMYMAPEQARGEPVDHRCDLFSLGSMLYRLCTGAFPFHGTDAISTLVAVSADHPLPPGEIDAAVPPALSELVMRLLAKDRNDRPASAQEVVEQIQRIEAGAPAVLPTSRAVTPTVHPPKEEASADASAATEIVAVAAGLPSRPRRWWMAVAALAAVFVMVWALGWSWIAAVVVVGFVAVIVVVNSDLDTKTNQGTLPYRVGAWLRRRWWKFAVVAAVVLVLVSLLNSNRQRSGSVPHTQREKTVIPSGFAFNIEENRLSEGAANNSLLWVSAGGALLPGGGVEPVQVGIIHGTGKSFETLGLEDLRRQQLNQPGSGVGNLPLGTVIAVKTATGKYAKLKIVRYYKLHDFDFPGAAEALTPAWKARALQVPDSRFGHVEVEWVLYLE